MEGSVRVLSQYRFQCAMENKESAEVLLQAKQFKSSVNRSYYAIFHCLRAVTALDQFDSSKHSGVIAFFNRTYVKEGVFDKSISKLIDTSYRLREKSDYQDFFLVSREMAADQLAKADEIISTLEIYLKKRWNEI